MLRPEGRQQRADVRRDVALAQAEVRLEALERAAEGERRAHREALVLKVEAALGRDAGGE